MHEFNDAKGRKWSIAITVASVKRVKEQTGIDLLDAKDRIPELATNPVLLCDVLCSLCRPAIVAANLTDEDFGEGLAGDAIDAATLAFLEDLADFFPKPAQRAAIRRLITTQNEVIQTGIDLVTAKIDAAIPQKKEEAIKRITAIVGSMFTDLPDSAA